MVFFKGFVYGLVCVVWCENDGVRFIIFDIRDLVIMGDDVSCVV